MPTHASHWHKRRPGAGPPSHAPRREGSDPHLSSLVSTPTHLQSYPAVGSEAQSRHISSGQLFRNVKFPHPPARRPARCGRSQATARQGQTRRWRTNSAEIARNNRRFARSIFAGLCGAMAGGIVCSQPAGTAPISSKIFRAAVLHFPSLFLFEFSTHEPIPPTYPASSSYAISCWWCGVPKTSIQMCRTYGPGQFRDTGRPWRSFPKQGTPSHLPFRHLRPCIVSGR